MSSAGKVAAAGIVGGFVAAGLALRAGFSELAESQKVAAQTRAVIRSTGGVANVSAKQVEKLATSLSRMSGVDDEAIAAGQNMLMTFTNIRNGVRKSDKVFNMATGTILDMSVALGRDIPDVAIMVGKALNDLEVNQKGTITGWSALRRVGVKVSSDMMAQAAAFLKAGKPMEAQKLLLRELATEFGGSARAFGTTMPGALGKLRNAFDEIAAAFAQGFLPLILKVANALTKKLANPAFVARVQRLGNLVGTTLYNAFLLISAWFQAHWGQIKTGFQVLSQVISSTVKGVQSLKNALDGLGKFAAVAFRAMLIPARTLLAVWEGILRVADKVGGWIPGLGGAIKGALEAVQGARAAVNAADDAMQGGGGRGQKRAKPGGRRRTARGAATAGIIPGQGRARGGPVWPGVSYRVGERGPETFVPGMPGTIVPNGAGTYIGTVHVHGVQNVRQLVGEIQRLAKHGGSQSRGARPGLGLAIN